MRESKGEVTEAGPSIAVQMVGLNAVPVAGDEFSVCSTEQEVLPLSWLLRHKVFPHVAGCCRPVSQRDSKPDCCVARPHPAMRLPMQSPPESDLMSHTCSSYPCSPWWSIPPSGRFTKAL